MVITTFDASEIQPEELLGNVAKLVSHQGAEVKTEHDIAGNKFLVSVQIPITKDSQQAMNELTKLGVKTVVG